MTQRTTHPAATWNDVQLPEDQSLLQSITDVVARWYSRHPDALPDVRQGPVLLLASDYGGQQKASQFEVYSFILIDYIYIGLWERLRKKLRADHLPDGRRMAFKDLHDNVRLRALTPFLRAANTLPGLLFTVAVRKGLGTTFSGLEAFMQTLSHAWTPQSIRRAGLVAGFASVLIAGLCDDRNPGQHAVWITDEDEILPSKERSEDSLHALTTIMASILPNNIGDVTIMTSARDDGSRSLEDIVAIPDLVSGALPEVLTQMRIDYNAGEGPRYYLPTGLSRKAGPVFEWYMESHHPLKRLVVIVDRAEPGYRAWATNFGHSAAPKESYDWTNEFLDYVAQLRPEHSQEDILRALNGLRDGKLAYEILPGIETASLHLPKKRDS